MFDLTDGQVETILRLVLLEAPLEQIVQESGASEEVIMKIVGRIAERWRESRDSYRRAPRTDAY